ncbi:MULTISPECIES: hypothetical protein [Idiomarina]|uniref:hypothetical protein n=1 Tax=Idiomarina TaxID=135575 RepID=UPI00241EAFF6|nr:MULTISPECIES: hypothetical protein [Idiomarina]
MIPWFAPCGCLTPRTPVRACEHPTAGRPCSDALGYGCDAPNLLLALCKALAEPQPEQRGARTEHLPPPQFLLLAHHAGSDDAANYLLLSECHQERNCQACDEPENFNAGHPGLWHADGGPSRKPN